MKKFNLLILLIVLPTFFLTQQLLASSSGRTGRTLKTSTSGCGSCHGSTATSGVVVSITGPDTVVLNQTTSFTLTISGGPASGSGCDIAAKYGTLSPVSSTIKLSGSELTHKANTAMSAGSISFQFDYVYSGAQTIDTLYATGLSTNSNGSSSGDQWNWAPSKQLVVVTPSPAPSTPVLISPVNLSVDQPISPQLIWNSVSGASTYHIQMAIDSQFTSLVIDDSTLVDTFKLASSLLNNTTYYWRVNAKNNGGTSGWSSVWQFLTVVSPPSVPILLDPVNHSIDQPVSIQLRWNTASGASTYHVQLATDSLFTTLVVNDSALVDTSRLVLSLLNSTTYCWRVSAKNVGGKSAWSNVWEFTTIISLPAAPLLLNPSNDAVNEPVSLQLMWHSVTGASSYHVQLATDSQFAAVVIDDSALVDTSKLASSLLNNTTYYWRVNAKNIGGTSAWSSVWKFTTIATLPAQVVLVLPINNATLSTDTIVFSWNAANPNVTKYMFELASDSAFTVSQIDSNIVDTSIIKRNLLSQKYWWRVRAYNVAGWGAYSEIRQFTITLTGVSDNRTLAYKFRLDQNYPNPFNPSTKIRFDVPEESYIKLKIFDLHGQELITLVNERRDVGSYEVQFDGSQLASGIYFYQLKTTSVSNPSRSFSSVQKMVLMK